MAVPISPGEPWGQPTVATTHAPICSDDRSTARSVIAGHEPVVRGGDLALALGVAGEGDPTLRLPVDIFVVRHVDSGREIARGIAHAVVHRSGPLGWLRDSATVIANTEYVRGRQLLPRAHPNDGLLDRLEIDATMPSRQRLQAIRRARVGNHLPHPDMRATRGDRFTVDVNRRSRLVVDGQSISVRGAVVIEVVVDGGAVNI